jgi:transglutaminase-like putative cysteine protease
MTHSRSQQTSSANPPPVSDQDVVRAFETVRDMPFGFGPHQDPATLLSCGFGTCAPKHTLLAQRFAALGLRSRYVYVTFRFNDMPGRFPPELAALLHDGKLRGHVALQLERAGRWVDVDATFDLPLAREGFRVNRHWDGRSSMPLTVEPVQRAESAQEPAAYEALQVLNRRAKLSADAVARINAWLNAVRQA